MFVWRYFHGKFCSALCGSGVFQLLSPPVQLLATPWAAATRLPCLLSPTVCSNSRPLSRWFYLPILSSAAPSFAFSLSQHQGLFQWVSSSHQVVLELQRQSFSCWNKFRVRIDWFDLLAIQEILKSSPAPQFESIISSWSNSHIRTWILEKP